MKRLPCPPYPAKCEKAKSCVGGISDPETQCPYNQKGKRHMCCVTEDTEGWKKK